DSIAEEAILLYQSGMSVKAVAKRFNVARHVIYRFLRIAGITPRNRSESMYLRMNTLSDEQRFTLTQKARTFAYDVPWQARQAELKQANLVKVGAGEELFMRWLKQRGINS